MIQCEQFFCRRRKVSAKCKSCLPIRSIVKCVQRRLNKTSSSDKFIKSLKLINVLSFMLYWFDIWARLSWYVHSNANWSTMILFSKLYLWTLTLSSLLLLAQNTRCILNYIKSSQKHVQLHTLWVTLCQAVWWFDCCQWWEIVTNQHCNVFLFLLNFFFYKQV